MADKVEKMTWLELVDNYKLKDNGLKKVLKDYAESKAKDEYDEALCIAQGSWESRCERLHW